MIVEGLNGRHQSVRTKEEKLKTVQDMYDSLDAEEKIAFHAILEEIVNAAGESKSGFDDASEIKELLSIYDVLSSSCYDGEIVDIDTFLDDKYYCGQTGRDLYPKWRSSLKELFAGEYNEAIITGGTGSGKCLSPETEFFNPVTNKRVTVGESVGRDNVHVVAYDRDSHRSIMRKATVFESGRKKLGTLRLSSGKEIRLTADHPVLGSDGEWHPIGEFSKGDLIATVRDFPEPLNPLILDDEEVEFIAFMLTDGSCSSGNWSFTKANSSILDRFVYVSRSMGGKLPTEKARNGSMKTLYSAGTQWVRRKYNLVGTSHTKRVPAELFGLSNRQVALLINRIIACDGHLQVERGVVEISLASKLFIEDIQQLLLRFGIHSRYSEKHTTSKRHDGTRFHGKAWRLTVSSASEIRKFCEVLGPILGKEEETLELYKTVFYNKQNSNVDIVPFGNKEFIRLCDELGIHGKKRIDFKVPKNHFYMSHDRFIRITEGLDLPDWCNWWGDLFWDTVKTFELDDEYSLVYDVEVPGPKNFCPYGIVVHNTTISEFVVIRMFYELSMLRNPQSAFGLMKGSEIILVAYNRDKRLARDVTFGGIKNKMLLSPFFQKHCIFKPTEVINKEKNIRIIAVSARSADALGRNVFGGIIDEADFLTGRVLGNVKLSETADGEKPFVEQLHNSILSRMKSRYERAGTNVPGVIVLSSSARNTTSFTNRRIAEARDDPTVFCRDYAPWDVKEPYEKFFSRDFFYLLVGNARIRHKIIMRDEWEKIDPAWVEKLRKDGCVFEKVPMNYLGDFQRDIEGAIRDCAGIVVMAVSTYIQVREAIYDAVDDTYDHPIEELEWISSNQPHFKWNQLTRMYKEKLSRGIYENYEKPIRNPDAIRHAHIDYSQGKTDAAGMAVGHIAGWIDVERRSQTGGIIRVERAPIIEMDLMLRILAPQGGEIDAGACRTIIYEMQQHGYKFGFVSMDSYQSAEALQKFNANGIRADKVSVDESVVPYDYLKLALYEGRLTMYHYPFVLGELEDLQRDQIKDKVVHLPNGAKDVSDSVAGVVYSLSTNIKERAPSMVGISSYVKGHEDATDEWIRNTMAKSGDSAVKKVGDVPSGGKPLFFMG